MPNPSCGELSVGCFILLISAAIGTVCRAIALCYMWEWFVMPLGVRAITLLWALGLSSLINLFIISKIEPKADPDKTFMSQVVSTSITGIASPLASLAIGYLIHLMMT